MAKRLRALLPSERRDIARLLRQGRITAAYLDIDGAAVFLLVPARNEESVRKTLDELPL